MVLCGDGEGANMSWVPLLNRSGSSVTLADIAQPTGEVDPSFAAYVLNVPVRQGIDPNRHQGKVNVLFLDGHAESVRADHTSLARCRLLED
jgi:prepilin-type processing-associated H-X9-DG protein